VNRRQCLVLVGAAPWALACRKKTPPPEERVRALMASVESAIEAGDVATVREVLSPLFSGNENLDKPGAMAMLQLRLRARKQIFLLTRVMDVDAVPGQLAGAELMVAMAAVPIPGPEALPNLEADVYRFQIALEEDADAPHGYRVKSAAWSPARWPL